MSGHRKSSLPDLETVRGFFQLSPFMVELGAEPVSVAEGRIGAELVLQRRHQQHTGQTHAGAMATLADHCMGSAAQTLAPEGHLAMTAEFKVSLLRPGKGERLLCEAWVVKGGRTLSFTEAEVYALEAGQRKLVMKASATMALVRASIVKD